MSDRILQSHCQKNTCHNHAMCMYTPCLAPKLELVCNSDNCEEECMGYADCRKPEHRMTTLTPDELNRRLAGLLGVDMTAKDDHDHIAAISSGFWNSDDNMMEVRWNGNAHFLLRLAWHENALTYWEQRHGKNWQADIEAHVAAWRRDPPPYATDLVTAFGLGEEMRKRGAETEQWFIYELRLIIAPERQAGGSEFATCHANAYDRSLAAYRALGGEEENG